MEEWRDIPGYEGRYQVSDLGRVRSLSFMQRYLLRTGVEAFRRTKEKILAQQFQNCGYRIVHLHLDNKRQAQTVHRLVAHAFLPGDPGETVNHRDGIKSNNSATNLEWATYSENHLHAVDHGLNPQAIRVAHPVTGRVFPSIAKAMRTTGVSRYLALRWARA